MFEVGEETPKEEQTSTDVEHEAASEWDISRRYRPQLARPDHSWPPREG